MKNYIMFLLAAFLSATGLQAQNSDYDIWAKQKHEEYDKWKKMHEEIVSHLPKNDKMDAISSWLDEGFESTKPGTIAPAVPSTSVAPHDQTTQPVQPSAGSSTIQPPPSPPPAPVHPANFKVWVIIVGVANYEKEDIRLNYTDDDAYKVYAFYKSPEGGSLPDSQITLLIDEDATRSNILKAINNMYNNAGNEDVVIFYFSGHGSENAFITYDYDGDPYNQNYKGLLLHNELNSAFEKSKAGYKYIVADACHSGNSAKTVQQRGIKATFYEAFDHTSRGELAMLLSSMGTEYSMEYSGVRQGVFSYYLLRGLKGEADKNKDGIVTVTELYDYIQPNVRSFTKNEQNPVLAGKYDDKMPISVVNGL